MPPASQTIRSECGSLAELPNRFLASHPGVETSGSQLATALLAKLAKVRLIQSDIQALQAAISRDSIPFRAQMKPLALDNAQLLRALCLGIDARLSAKGLKAQEREDAQHVLMSISTDPRVRQDLEILAMLSRYGTPEKAGRDAGKALAQHVHLDPNRRIHADPGSCVEPPVVAAPSAAELARGQKAVDLARAKAALGASADAALKHVFRQLAKALHPDREPNALERTRKTTLMAQLNAANDQRDIVAMLELCLELPHPNAVFSDVATPMLAMKALLDDQLAALRASQADAQHHAIVAFELDGFDLPTPKNLARLLQGQRQRMLDQNRVLNARLQGLQRDREFKAWIASEIRAMAQRVGFQDTGSIQA